MSGKEKYKITKACVVVVIIIIALCLAKLIYLICNKFDWPGWIDMVVSLITGLIFTGSTLTFITNKLTDWIFVRICRISDLEPKFIDEKAYNKASILWIDDNNRIIEDDYSPALIEGGLNKVVVVHELLTMNQIEDYQIVICDYDGIGGKLNAKNGGELVRKIKDVYLDKVVIMISSMSSFKENYPSDEFIRRDASISSETITMKIQEWVNNYYKPSYFWKICISNIKVKEYNASLERDIQNAFVIDYANENTKKMDKVLSNIKDSKYIKLANACIKYINSMKNL